MLGLKRKARARLLGSVLTAVAALCAAGGGAAARPVVVDEVSDLEAVADFALVALDISLDLAPSKPVRLIYRNGRSEFLASCLFGAYEGVAALEPDAGNNHLLVEIIPGAPDRHAANAVFCEYGVKRGQVVGQGSLSVSGCYLVRVFSIPTARQVSLRPLEASACGWGR